MMPLGPFNGKACGTSISPWIITLDALKEAGSIIPADKSGLQGGKATSLPFLSSQDDLSIQVSTFLSSKILNYPFIEIAVHNDPLTSPIRGDGLERALISKGNLRHMHWSPFQMLAHHTSAGCGLGSGDLLGTGTLSSSQQQADEDLNVSGGNAGRLGCLYELTEAGKVQVELGAGNGTLTWLEDGDEITLEGWAGEGDSRIGFGSVTGKILPPAAQIPS